MAYDLGIERMWARQEEREWEDDLEQQIAEERCYERDMGRQREQQMEDEYNTALEIQYHRGLLMRACP